MGQGGGDVGSGGGDPALAALIAEAQGRTGEGGEDDQAEEVERDRRVFGIAVGDGGLRLLGRRLLLTLLLEHADDRAAGRDRAREGARGRRRRGGDAALRGGALRRRRLLDRRHERRDRRR